MALTFNIDGTLRGGVQSLRYGSGTSKNANPQRPTIALGNGRLTIAGYRTSLRKKLIVYEGTVKMLEAWLQNEKYDEVTGFSQYDLEGLLVRAGRSRVEINQTSATANANQTAVTNLMRNAFGLSAMQVSIPSTPLADYEFEGPAAGYASSFGQVSGGLPYETNTGLLGIKSPFRVPTSLTGTFSERDYRIRDIFTEFDQGQLWNKALIQYDGPETNHSGNATGSVKDPGAGGASGVVTDLTIANPASGVKVEDMEATLTVGAATGQWREILGDPGSGNATGTVTDPGQSDLRGVDTNLTLNDPATGHVIEELAATMTVGAATGTWEEVQGDPHSGSGNGNVTNPGAFGASGVLTNITLANPDANHRVEDMGATFTVGAATASYTIDDRDLSANASVDRSRWSGTPVSITGRLSTEVTLGDTERITNVSASAVVTAPFPNQGTITGNGIALGEVSVVGGRLSVDYEVLNPIVFGSRRSWGGLTLLGDAYLTATTNPNGTFAWIRDITGQGARRVASNVTMTVTVTFSYTVHDRATYNLPAPTSRTAPSWEVERVSRSQNPNNRNQSFVRVTLVGTDQPGTWRINDSGTNVDVTSWEHSTGGKTYRLGGIAVSISATWRLRDTRTHTVTPSRLQAPNWSVDRVSRSTDPTNRNRKFVRVTVADAHEPGRWRINDGSNTVDFSSWEHTANRRLYRITGISTTFAVTWRTRDTRTHTVTPTRRTAPRWDVDRVGLTDNPNNVNNRLVRITLGGTDSPGTWRINDGTRNVDLTSWTREANRREYKILTIAVSFVVKWVLDDENVYTLEAQSDDSIREWGDRVLTFPVWFRRTAQAALQARIDTLAVARNIHTIEFYMDQRDATKSANIAALQPGQYIAVPHVGSIVYIMYSELEVDTQRSDIKRLTCIDTGTAHVPTEPANALSWRGEALTWRAADNYLTWR